jgi:hypothetical protein
VTLGAVTQRGLPKELIELATQHVPRLSRGADIAIGVTKTLRLATIKTAKGDA